ncbi:hypothetical protein LCGC14_0273920 [marine sediment metagenome]|uniref:Uncharacterized protein n=2 Tax=root TaxID=1 RepID=A0A9C9NJG6_9HYPH|nr:hypothetical protein [Aurantimonas coralicida]
MNKLRELLALLKKLQTIDNTGDAAMMAGDLQDPAYTIELEKIVSGTRDADLFSAYLEWMLEDAGGQGLQDVIVSRPGYFEWRQAL